MGSPAEKCTVYYYLIDRYEIHFLRFIVEAYPGLGVVSTVDPALGLVRISIAPGCESDMFEILDAERENLKLREIDPGSELFTSLFERGGDGIFDAVPGRKN